MRHKALDAEKAFANPTQSAGLDKTVILHRSKMDSEIMTAFQITRKKAPDRRQKAPGTTTRVAWSKNTKTPIIADTVSEQVNRSHYNGKLNHI
jgi:hypothetical protein